MTQDMMSRAFGEELRPAASRDDRLHGRAAEALEVEGLTGAGHGERSADRITHRNGYRDRSCGDAPARSPEDPEAEEGELLPRFLEPGGWPRRRWLR